VGAIPEGAIVLAHMGSDDIDLDAKLAASSAPVDALPVDAPRTDAPPVAEVTELSPGSEVAGATEVADAGQIDLVSGLATGALDPIAAQQLLIEQVLAEQLPGIPPERLERLRLELATLLDGDPTLAGLLRR
jgi:hypothetical protein